MFDRKKKRNGLRKFLMVSLAAAAVTTVIPCNVNGKNSGGLGTVVTINQERIRNELITVGEQNPPGHFKWSGRINLLSQTPDKTKLPENLIKNDNDMDDFLESDKTIALVSEMPKEDIYIYGLRKIGYAGKNDRYYSLEGIGIRHGQKIQVFDIPWGIYNHIPQSRYFDYDKDGRKELAIILRSDAGCDLSLVELYVFEKTEIGGWKYRHFDDWPDKIDKAVTYHIKKGILKLYVNGVETKDKINIKAFEKRVKGQFDSVGFGNIDNFTFEDEKIYLHVLPRGFIKKWIPSQNITNNYIKMQVVYDGKNFTLK